MYPIVYLNGRSNGFRFRSARRAPLRLLVPVSEPLDGKGEALHCSCSLVHSTTFLESVRRLVHRPILLEIFEQDRMAAEPRAESPPPDAILTMEKILQDPPQAPKRSSQLYTRSDHSTDYDITLAWPISSGSGIEPDDKDHQEYRRQRLPSPRKLFHKKPIRSFFRNLRPARRDMEQQEREERESTAHQKPSSNRSQVRDGS